MINIRPEYAKQRMIMCKLCKSYNHPTKTCNECHCLMPGKTMIKSASCPLNKWQSIKDEETP